MNNQSVLAIRFIWVNNDGDFLVKIIFKHGTDTFSPVVINFSSHIIELRIHFSTLKLPPFGQHRINNIFYSFNASF